MSKTNCLIEISKPYEPEDAEMKTVLKEIDIIKERINLLLLNKKNVLI
jgi:hypothetical protein